MYKLHAAPVSLAHESQYCLTQYKSTPYPFNTLERRNQLNSERCKCDGATERAHVGHIVQSVVTMTTKMLFDKSRAQEMSP